MKTPPLLLGAALIFWGWQTGLLFFGIGLALIFEGSRLVKSKVDFSLSDFKRISDLCTLLFVGVIIYLYASNRSTHAIIVLLQWLPLIFLPISLAQVYGTSEKIDISALFMMFRWEKTREGHTRPTVNLTYPYLALCILSASAGNMRTIWFYLGIFVLSAWALWFSRTRRFSPVVWVSLLMLIGFIGYGGQLGIRVLQGVVEKKALELFEGFSQKDMDPYQATTAMGEIGLLKLSDRIVLRVKPESQQRQPLLLREASYNKYRSSMWFAVRSKFKSVPPHADGTTWELHPDPGESKSITVSEKLVRGKGMVKAPQGAFQVEDLPVLKMEENQFGAVRVEEGPGLINYRLSFDQRSSFDAPPDETDLAIPEEELPAISTIIRELDLTSQSPQEIMAKIAGFFQTGFTYSLVLESTPLQHFLLRRRSGHCEYFATATVLLLRAAGIPARYAVGYSVDEFSELENRFVVRASHAHAWTLAYLDGAWREFDTTPSSWHELESEAASIWQPLSDLWSWFMFKFSEWRWSEGDGNAKKYMWILLIPLVILLARKFYSKERRRRTKQERTARKKAQERLGTDSEFYLIEKRLNELGYVRHPWETLSDWIGRIEESRPVSFSTEPLQSIMTLHYRYRFDPKGVSNQEKATLKSNVQSWLKTAAANE